MIADFLLLRLHLMYQIFLNLDRTGSNLKIIDVCISSTALLGSVWPQMQAYKQQTGAHCINTFIL